MFGKSHQPLRVAIVSPLFPPEPVVSGKTSAQIAEALSASGCSVSVITAFPNRPGGRVFSGYRRRFLQKESSGTGITVLRCFSFVSRESTFRSRLLENLSFGLLSSLILASGPRPDVLYLNSWPLFATALTVLVAKARRVPVVLSVQDLYPESLAAQGRAATDSILLRTLGVLDRWIARSAHSIIAISDGFRHAYLTTRGLDPDRVHVIPNWTRERPLGDPYLTKRFRSIEKKIAPDSLLLLYGGNVGLASGLEEFIDSFCRLSLDSVCLLVAGEGSRLQQCMARGKHCKLGNICFHFPWVESETETVLGSADILLLTMRGEQANVSVPSKLLAYMMSGRPVLGIVPANSEVGRVIDRSGCGWVIPPDDDEQLRRLLVEIAQQPEERSLRGQRGREYVLATYSDRNCLPAAVAVILRAAGGCTEFDTSSNQ